MTDTRTEKQGDGTELYYAEMEAHRNQSEDAYFDARPDQFGLVNSYYFRAGFERAFALFWNKGHRP